MNETILEFYNEIVEQLNASPTGTVIIHDIDTGESCELDADGLWEIKRDHYLEDMSDSKTDLGLDPDLTDDMADAFMLVDQFTIQDDDDTDDSYDDMAADLYDRAFAIQRMHNALASAGKLNPVDELPMGLFTALSLARESLAAGGRYV